MKLRGSQYYWIRGQAFRTYGSWLPLWRLFSWVDGGIDTAAFWLAEHFGEQVYIQVGPTVENGSRVFFPYHQWLDELYLGDGESVIIGSEQK